jgi:type III restriction enzyme
MTEVRQKNEWLSPMRSLDWIPANPASGFFQPEYGNIFGVPFTFLPHEGGGDQPPPPPPTPKTRIETLPERKGYEIVWPNVIRIGHDYRPTLTLDLANAKPLTLDAYETSTLAELAPVIEGKPDVTRLSEISLLDLGERFRTQKIVFSAASDIYEQMKTTWKGNREYLLAQVIRLVEKYIESDKLRIEPPLFNQDPMRRRIIITLHMSSVAEHLKQAIHFENTSALVPIFDTERPIRARAIVHHSQHANDFPRAHAVTHEIDRPATLPLQD